MKYPGLPRPRLLVSVRNLFDDYLARDGKISECEVRGVTYRDPSIDLTVLSLQLPASEIKALGLEKEPDGRLSPVSLRLWQEGNSLLMR